MIAGIRYRWVAAPILAAATAIFAVAAPGREAISAAQIAAAISGAGMPVSARQVTLLTEVVSTDSAPTLKVQSMAPWGNHQVKVRLSCARSEECLPFFVAVHGADLHSTQLASEDSDFSMAGRLKRDPKSFAVKSGSQATLFIDGDKVHIRLSVVCLEGGAPGETIRVASRDHRQIYNAEVVDGTVLRGKL
jgi:hypothetical protein